MNAPGKGLLKVVSILFIIFGAIATVVSIIGLIGTAALGAYSAMVGINIGIYIVAMIIATIASVLELIIGIIGLKKCADPAQGKFFIIMGIILCVLQLVSMILFFSVTSLIGFVLPVLFIIGGFMNQKAAA